MTPLDRIRVAKATCSCCAECGAKLAADAPVWRMPVEIDPHAYRSRTRVAPVCEGCKPLFTLYPTAAPCVT